MTTYHDTYQRVHDTFPPHVSTWVDKACPCRCDGAWRDRGMHSHECGWVNAVELLDMLHEDGLLMVWPTTTTRQPST